MEFPYLGEHCNRKECNLLDFLPFTCNACKLVFCKDHYNYEKHDCEKIYTLNNVVPVCPLCNQPIPSKRNQPPDICINEHIEQDCADLKAKSKRNEIYKNKCFYEKCKGKEIMPLICQNCSQNFCLKHRHPSDHKCSNKFKNQPNTSRPTNSASILAGKAAIKRFTENLKPTSSLFSNFKQTSSTNYHSQNIKNGQGNLTEDEIIAFAINESLKLTNQNHKSQKNLNEDADLKKALELSKKEYEKNNNCSIN